MLKPVKPLIAAAVALVAAGTYHLKPPADPPRARMSFATCAPGQHCAPVTMPGGEDMSALPSPGSRASSRPTIDRDAAQRWETATFGLG